MLMVMSNPINLLYAKYFCDAVRLGSITASARANFVTQSAVSQGISKLENMLKCTLLARHPNQFRLTPGGEEAVRGLSELLKKADNLQDELAENNGSILGDLSFACTHSFALGLIAPYLSRFRLENPRTKINFQCIGGPTKIMHLLKMGIIDFGIAPKVGDFSGFEQTYIYQGSYGLYRSSQLQDEKELPFILPEPEDTTTFKEAYLREYKKEPEIFLKVGSWEVVANLAAEGLGIGYFPDYVAQKKQHILIPCYQNLLLPKYEICSLHLAGMKIRKSSRIFLSYFQL
ncbi:MAG: HTH-type transcriptional regulator CysB [Chlamydiae bacterium]|nr:HTH-type transcriptional regulator CysB [Chlamydiota bacterium]